MFKSCPAPFARRSVHELAELHASSVQPGVPVDLPRGVRGIARYPVAQLTMAKVTQPPNVKFEPAEEEQQADGSIVIPEALRPWMGGIEVITP